MESLSLPYRGRFAPTPSGPLHFGSLVTALASWLEARTHQGQWQLRIEDIDPPREMPGAADQILFTLEAFGLTWDGPVVYQSQRHEAYQHALDQLRAQGRAYPCYCTRKQRQGQSIYLGHCRHQPPPHTHLAPAWRFALEENSLLCWEDQLQGHQAFNFLEIGDPIIRRRDGYWAYQLAVVVDDLEAGMTHLVRGYDLLDSTPWQLALYQALAPEQKPPTYLHLPLIINAQGQKLSKQNHAPAICASRASAHLIQALEYLNQPILAEWASLSVEALLSLAVQHWDRTRLPSGQHFSLLPGQHLE